MNAIQNSKMVKSKGLQWLSHKSNTGQKEKEGNPSTTTQEPINNGPNLKYLSNTQLLLSNMHTCQKLKT